MSAAGSNAQDVFTILHLLYVYNQYGLGGCGRVGGGLACVYWAHTQCSLMGWSLGLVVVPSQDSIYNIRRWNISKWLKRQLLSHFDLFWPKTYMFMFYFITTVAQTPIPWLYGLEDDKTSADDQNSRPSCWGSTGFVSQNTPWAAHLTELIYRPSSCAAISLWRKFRKIKVDADRFDGPGICLLLCRQARFAYRTLCFGSKRPDNHNWVWYLWVREKKKKVTRGSQANYRHISPKERRSCYR